MLRHSNLILFTLIIYILIIFILMYINLKKIGVHENKLTKYLIKRTKS